MSRQTQAEILIKTLAELRNAECERQAERLRLRCKAHAEKFIKAYRPELEDGGRPSKWFPQSKQTAQAAERPVQDE